jgi:hypothetical protein
VYQFQNTVQVKKTQNCVSVSTPWRAMWQKTQNNVLIVFFSKLTHYPALLLHHNKDTGL